MRKSRVLLAGVAVAAAAAATSAFTAANDFDAVADDAVGYGTTTVSGATIIDSDYAVTPGDLSTLDSITYTSSEEIPTGNAATIYLKSGGTGTAALVTRVCTIAAWVDDAGDVDPAVGTQEIVCTFAAPVAINSFDTVELTVMPA